MQDNFVGNAAGGFTGKQSGSERKVTPYSSTGASQTSVQIYVVYNKPAGILQSPIFKPIQTGRANTDLRLEMIGDDTGDNISSRNDRFCELSALYWIWKNDKTSDYAGLFHYRRHLNLSGTEGQESEWGFTEFPVIDQSYQERNGLTLAAVDQIVRRHAEINASL